MPRLLSVSDTIDWMRRPRGHTNAGTEASIAGTALRLRAEEVLTHAEVMRDAETQRRMRGVAATYEEFAQGLEQHAGDLDEM